MTTFKAEVAKRDKRKDGTYNVKIRITHNRKVRRYATQMYATDGDITRSGKIKNQIILDNTDTIIKGWRKKLLSLGELVEQMDVDAVVKHLCESSDEGHIPMFPWMWGYANKIGKENTRNNYTSAIRMFEKWVGYDMSFTQLKSSTIREYLQEHGDNGHRSMRYIRKMFKEAMLEYNEDDIIRIPDDPFSRVKIVCDRHQRKRSITADAIRMIARIPDENNERSSRNIARDMFLLSFCLLGINMVDIYTASAPKNGVLSYNRTKTKDQREDEAFISINIHPIAQALIDRHKDDRLLTNISKRYSSVTTANQCVNRGIHRIAEYLIEQHRGEFPADATDEEIFRSLGFEDFTFYSARHSWATIARNDVNVDKWTVHEGLNHVDASTSITDVYIKRDFTRINEANFKVIEYVFGDVFAKVGKFDK